MYISFRSYFIFYSLRLLRLFTSDLPLLFLNLSGSFYFNIVMCSGFCTWRCSLGAIAFCGFAFLFSFRISHQWSDLFLYNFYCTRLLHFSSVIGVPPFSRPAEIVFLSLFRFCSFTPSHLRIFFVSVGITVFMRLLSCSNFYTFCAALVCSISVSRFCYVSCFRQQKYLICFQTAFRSVCLLTYRSLPEFHCFCNSKAYCS